MTLTAVLPAYAQRAPYRGVRPIEFSEPRSDVISSNVNQLRTPKQTSLQDLEKEIKKPFELLSPGSEPAPRLSTTPALRTPQSAARTKQMKELLEKRNEWIFLDPEDYHGLGLTAEEMLRVTEYEPDGRVKKEKTPLEQYYEKMDKARADLHAMATNRARSDDFFNLRSTDEPTDRAKERGFAGQPNPVKSGSGELELNPNPQPATEASSFNLNGKEQTIGQGFAEFFGFGKPESPEEVAKRVRNQEAHQKEFKDLLGVPASSPLTATAGPLEALTGDGLVTPPSLATGGLGKSPGANQSVSTSQPPSASPNASVATSILPGAQANAGLPAWQTTLAPPAPETTRKPLQTPSFQIPQRKF